MEIESFYWASTAGQYRIFFKLKNQLLTLTYVTFVFQLTTKL